MRIRTGLLAGILVSAVTVATPKLVASAQTEERGLPITERVSISADGAEGNGASNFPSISADGRFVAFHSSSFNLTPDDPNGAMDIFVHDRDNATIERVSFPFDNTPQIASSFNPSISGNGRLVAFFSHARNLVPGDTNGHPDIFVHDRQTHTTERVSIAGDGSQGNHGSLDPSMSDDGRFVAFTSFASNLVPGDTNVLPDVFVHDRETGSTELISVASDGAQTNKNTFDVSISSDGRFVAFYSEATNLVPGDTNREPDPNGLFTGLDVFVHDRATGSTERVSVSSEGTEANKNAFVTPAPVLSSDGRYIVFYSAATNLVPNDTNRDSVNAPALDVFVHDRETHTTERVSVTSEGTEGDSHSLAPTISRDGLHVAFHSVATNLVPGDTNHQSQGFISGDDVFVHDRSTRTTERVSVASDGTQGDQDSSGASMSSDGRFVAFHSSSTNLVAGDTNSSFDVFVRDEGGPVKSGERGTYPLVPGDPYFADQWGSQRIRVSDAWQLPLATGFGIKVAVIDTGIDLQHEDLRCPGKLALGAAVVDREVDEGLAADDIDGHGTHVAGIIGACTDNRFGTAGVAPDATLLPYRVFNEFGTTDFADVADAITRATDAGAHVINMSLGPLIGPVSYVPGLFADVDEAIERAASLGVVLVAAAGNDSLPLCEYPALAADAICVGATDNRDLKAWYSTFANRQDEGAAVVAPGGTELVVCDIHAESILSLYPKEFDGCAEGRFGYRDLNGTSMAAPHVSGIAALVYDRLGGTRSPENAQLVTDAIVTTTEDLGRPGRDPIYGSGLVNALAAVTAVEGSEPTSSPSATSSESASASPTEPAKTQTDVALSDVASAQYSDEAFFEARLTDSNGDPIPATDLSFELAGAEPPRTFSATTDAQGIASVTPTIQEKPGPYSLTVRYAGDDAHDGSADTTTIVIDKEDSDLDLVVEGNGNKRTLTARLADADTPDHGIAGRTIDFYADGELIGSESTNDDGFATLKAPPRYRGGKHDFEASFSGDDYYAPSSDRRSSG